MKKIIFGLILMASPAFAGTMTIFQNLGGNLGTVQTSTGPAPVATAGTFTYIQSKSCSAATFTDACAFNTNITAHSLIVVGCVQNATGNTINVSDNNGNTYSTATVVNDGAATKRTGIYYALNANAGATTVTCKDNTSGAAWMQQSIHEYSGTASAVFDLASSSAPATATANPTATAMNTSLANEFVFAFNGGNGGTVTAQSGTLRENFVDNVRQASEDTVVSSAGSYQSTFTATAGGNPWMMLQAAFK